MDSWTRSRRRQLDDARIELNISSLHQRRQLAAVAVLYKMHTSKCPTDLRALLSQPYVVTSTTLSSMSMHVMRLQYQCPERFPLARHSSTQQSMYGTACQILLFVTLEMVLNPSRVRCMSIYCHLFETFASALQFQFSFCCESLIRPWGYLS